MVGLLRQIVGGWVDWCGCYWIILQYRSFRLSQRVRADLSEPLRDQRAALLVRDHVGRRREERLPAHLVPPHGQHHLPRGLGILFLKKKWYSAPIGDRPPELNWKFHLRPRVGKLFGLHGGASVGHRHHRFGLGNTSQSGQVIFCYNWLHFIISWQEVIKNYHCHLLCNSNSNRKDRFAFLFLFIWFNIPYFMYLSSILHRLLHLR